MTQSSFFAKDPNDLKMHRDVLAVSVYKPLGYVEHSKLLEGGKRVKPTEFNHIPDPLVNKLLEDPEIYILAGRNPKEMASKTDSHVSTSPEVKRCLVYHKRGLENLLTANLDIVNEMFLVYRLPQVNNVNDQVLNKFLTMLSDFNKYPFVDEKHKALICAAFGDLEELRLVNQEGARHLSLTPEITTFFSNLKEGHMDYNILEKLIRDDRRMEDDQHGSIGQP